MTSLKPIVNFLRALAENNNKPWFDAHKSEYLQCKAIFDDFALRLIERVATFDPSIGQLQVKDCTYRIYRDTRFSKDKTPYKTHMGVFIAPGGKKSGMGGYYLQIGAYDYGYDSGCMLASGHYCYEKSVVQVVREDIILDDGKTFGDALVPAQTAGFSLDYDGALKRVPASMPQDKPFSDWLRLKNYCLVKSPGLKYMSDPNLLDKAAADFESTAQFMQMINRAIAYTREEGL